VQPLVGPVSPQQHPRDKHRTKGQEHECECERQWRECHSVGEPVQTGCRRVACGLACLSSARVLNRRIPGRSYLSSTARAHTSMSC
jgi:hypothetical protein